MSGSTTGTINTLPRQVILLRASTDSISYLQFWFAKTTGMPRNAALGMLVAAVTDNNTTYWIEVGKKQIWWQGGRLDFPTQTINSMINLEVSFFGKVSGFNYTLQWF